LGGIETVLEAVLVTAKRAPYPLGTTQFAYFPGVSGPLSTHTEVKPQAGTSLESIKSLVFKAVGWVEG